MIKKLLYLIPILLLLGLSPGGGGADSPYTIGADPGDDYVSWTAMQLTESEAAGETVSFRKGETFREQITVPASGGSGNVITYTAHGEGADPIINGADLVGTWTEYGTWQTAWDPVAGNTTGSAGERNYRNIMAAATSSYSGTKVRVTAKAGAGGSFTFDGCSIGLMTTADDFDSAPTRITWDSGSSGDTIGASATSLSDEMTFSFDKTLRYGVHFHMDNRENTAYTPNEGDGMYYTLDAGDDTLTQSVAYSTDHQVYSLDKLEVYESAANVWQAACTTEPSSVYFNGTIGTLQASAAACTSVRDWFWDSNVLYTYSTTDPDTAYDDPGIEAAKRLDCIHIDNKDYVTIDGLSIKYASWYGMTLIDGCDDIIIQNNTIDYCSRKGIKLQGDNTVITNCSILNNTISNIGDGGAGAENAIHINGVDADNESTGNIIEGNVISNTVKGAILLRYADSTIVRYNETHGTGESNVYIQESDSIQIYYNIFDHDGDNDNDYAFYIHDASIGTEVYNNVIVNNGNDNGLYCSADSTGTKFKNNIYTGSGRAIYVADGGETDFESDYNDLDVSGTNIAYWLDSNYTTLALYQAASSHDANSIDSDPLMTNPGGDDFTLNPHSPCVNAGTDVSLTEDYQGLKIRHAPDIGAHENQASAIFSAMLRFITGGKIGT